MIPLSSPLVYVAPPPSALNFNSIMSIDEDVAEEWHLPIERLVRLFLCVALLGVLPMIVALVIKLVASLMNCDEESSVEEAIAAETDALLPKEVGSFTYGTCEEEGDLESGNSICSSSSEDLYDGKICVVCYDDERDCFFIPCGHCVTCQSCANRIFEGESRNCPICRRLIQRVNKLFIS